MNRNLLTAIITDPPSTTDGQLLADFVASANDAAFAALVRRHGRLVWSVCRSTCYREADAEDAFQATFVALLRAAPSLVPHGSLGPWLHTTARRVANKANLATLRRSHRERRVAVSEADTRPAETDWERTALAVHDELARLPEALRTAFVLCVLEGVGVSQAAERLGWKLGTLSGRLTRAKQELQRRLLDRGLTATAVAAAVLGTGVTSAVPHGVTSSVLTFSTTVVPTKILHLAQEGIMFGKLKLLVAAVVMTVGFGASVGGWRAVADGQTPDKPPAEPAKLANPFRNPGVTEAGLLGLVHGHGTMDCKLCHRPEPKVAWNFTTGPSMYYFIPRKTYDVLRFEKLLSTNADGRIPAGYQFAGSVRLNTVQMTKLMPNVVTDDPNELDNTRETDVYVFRKSVVLDEWYAEVHDANRNDAMIRLWKTHAESLSATPASRPAAPQPVSPTATTDDVKMFQDLLAKAKPKRSLNVYPKLYGLKVQAMSELIHQAGQKKFAADWKVTLHVRNVQFLDGRPNPDSYLEPSGPEEQIAWLEQLLEATKPSDIRFFQELLRGTKTP